MNTLTIHFASKTDLDTARNQIAKAKEYAGKDRQLGILGQALLLQTLVRAKSIETEDQKGKVASTWEEIENGSKETLKEIERIWNGLKPTTKKKL